MRRAQESESFTMQGAGAHRKRVVTIGGGSGPFGLLSSLKFHPYHITAIVTMADSGGSSRRLMDEFGQLPFGDLRQALVALSHKDALWRNVFTFRFRKNGKSQPEAEAAAHAQEVAEQAGVSGHSLGNLIISALQDINGGDLLKAIAAAQELLGTSGTVLPITKEKTDLCAVYEDGSLIRGETDIDTRGQRNLGPLPAISRVYLDPVPAPCQEALDAIHEADVIIIGPGDLYTSIVPNLLVKQVAEAVRTSTAQKNYVCNLMTKHGETDGFSASRFVKEIHHYLGGHVDRVFLHTGVFPDDLVEYYAEARQSPVRPDVEEIRRLGVEVIVENFLPAHHDHLIRHDAERLVQAIFSSSDSVK